MIATDYAQALYELGDRVDMTRVREALARRKHSKLLPRIFAEYQKLALREERAKKRLVSDPAQERTRVLIELYKKLVTTH